MSVLIQCAAMPGWWRDGHPQPDVTGQYLVAYDPGAESGAGWVWSPDRADAQRFPTVREAHATWTAVNPLMPARPTDGKPNRPLTAFTVAMEVLPEEVTP